MFKKLIRKQFHRQSTSPSRKHLFFRDEINRPEENGMGEKAVKRNL
jgi:hypothetical protein